MSSRGRRRSSAAALGSRVEAGGPPSPASPSRETLGNPEPRGPWGGAPTQAPLTAPPPTPGLRAAPRGGPDAALGSGRDAKGSGVRCRMEREGGEAGRESGLHLGVAAPSILRGRSTRVLLGRPHRPGRREAGAESHATPSSRGRAAPASGARARLPACPSGWMARAPNRAAIFRGEESPCRFKASLSALFLWFRAISLSKGSGLSFVNSPARLRAPPSKKRGGGVTQKSPLYFLLQAVAFLLLLSP